MRRGDNAQMGGGGSGGGWGCDGGCVRTWQRDGVPFWRCESGGEASGSATFASIAYDSERRAWAGSRGCGALERVMRGALERVMRGGLARDAGRSRAAKGERGVLLILIQILLTCMY